MAAAIAGATLALVGPLDSVAGRSVAWHMAQHVILIAVVSPLAALGRPNEVLPWLLPERRRRRLVRAGRRWSRRAGAQPWPALVALVTTTWLFHVPSVYDAATSSSLIHVVEHTAFIVTGWVFWWSLIGRRDRAAYGRAVLIVFLLALASTALGSILVSTRRPLYELGVGRTPAERLADQQLAGVVMWGFGGIATAVAAISLFAVWLREAERRAPSSPTVAGESNSRPARGISPSPGRLYAIGPVVPIVIAVAATGAFAAWSPTPAAPTTLPAVDSAPADVYERDCAECHGAGGEGGGDKGPPLVAVDAAYVDYVVSTGRMPLDDPDDEIERSTPAYDRSVSADLARFVASLGDPQEPSTTWPVPEIDVTAADVANGGEVYRLNCAACHQSVGVGGALVTGAAPPLTEATPTQIAEAVRVGPFEMPAFGDAALSDDDVRDVSGYVVDVVQRPDDRGGWGIGHLGPVPEGAVALLLGLTMLGLIAFWIEGRPRSAAHDSDDEPTPEPHS